ncbi:RHS repeat-associated core domain-containing protein [Kribbella sp. NPDC020789]
MVRTDDSVAGTSSYTYDALNRLTGTCYGVDQCTADAKDYIRYDYDGAGNRIWEQRPESTTWSMYGPASELIGALTTTPAYPAQRPKLRVHKYDADGNLLSDGTTSYTWSAAGKPVSSTTGNATTTYTHSGEGRRATAATGPQTTKYLWDPLSPQILNTATTKAAPTRYLYGASLLGHQSGRTLTPLTTTPNGSLSTTATATPTHHTYDPYGLPRPAAGPSTQAAPGYIGALQLPSGNYLLNQREYNPTTATFLTPDQGGSPNPYAYTSGNPLKSTDLQGLSDVEGTLTDVSHVSGYVSTGALTVAIACTFIRACAPAIPIAMQVSAATGMVSAGTAGILDSQACVVKGNCSALAADVALGALSSRFPALGTAGKVAADARAARVFQGFESVPGARTRTINFRPSASDARWGLTRQHLNKHLFGSGRHSLRTIDPAGTTDQWVGYIQDLARRPSTAQLNDGIEDIVGTFPKADGSGTFQLGIRISPLGDGTFDLVTVLTRQDR